MYWFDNDRHIAVMCMIGLVEILAVFVDIS